MKKNKTEKNEWKDEIVWSRNGWKVKICFSKKISRHSANSLIRRVMDWEPKTEEQELITLMDTG